MELARVSREDFGFVLDDWTFPVPGRQVDSRRQSSPRSLPDHLVKPHRVWRNLETTIDYLLESTLVVHLSSHHGDLWRSHSLEASAARPNSCILNAFSNTLFAFDARVAKQQIDC